MKLSNKEFHRLIKHGWDDIMMQDHVDIKSINQKNRIKDGFAVCVICLLAASLVVLPDNRHMELELDGFKNVKTISQIINSLEELQ